jgi:hypothetical protein
MVQQQFRRSLGPQHRGAGRSEWTTYPNMDVTMTSYFRIVRSRISAGKRKTEFFLAPYLADMLFSGCQL